MNMKVHRWETITALAAAASLALAIGAAPPQAAPLVESTKVSAGLSASDLSKLPLTDRHLTKREKANLAVVLRAYHDGEGDSLDPQGFRDLFAEDGVLNGIGGVEGQTSLRGAQLSGLITFLAQFLPDIHRERRRRQHRAVDQGHLPRAVRDARRRDPADGGQARHPDRRLLVPAQRQGRGVRLPHRFYHLVRAARHTAGLRVRSRGVRVRTIRPTDKGARLLSSRALQAG